MVCRDRGRGEKALAAVRRLAGDDRAELEIADLSSFESVRGLTDRLSARFDRIEMLVNNAGVFRARRELSVDGFEVTLATNHLGHYLLTVRLMDLLRRGRARIVNVSSNGHRRGDLRRAPLEKILRGDISYGGVQAYGDSKLANILFTFELMRRHGGEGIAANSLHPGVLATRIWNQNRTPLSLLTVLLKPLMSRRIRRWANRTGAISRSRKRRARPRRRTMRISRASCGRRASGSRARRRDEHGAPLRGLTDVVRVVRRDTEG
jgi:NAD(P)-dependent dehydrogenase (short-subunit alcohol dehydrogenase family)